MSCDLEASDTKHFDNAVLFAHCEENSQRGCKQRSQALTQFDALGGGIHAKLLIDGIGGHGDGAAILRMDPNFGQFFLASAGPDHGVADHLCSNDRR